MGSERLPGGGHFAERRRKGPGGCGSCRPPGGGRGQTTTEIPGQPLPGFSGASFQGMKRERPLCASELPSLIKQGSPHWYFHYLGRRGCLHRLSEEAWVFCSSRPKKHSVDTCVCAAQTLPAFLQARGPPRPPWGFLGEVVIVVVDSGEQTGFGLL